MEPTVWILVSAFIDRLVGPALGWTLVCVSENMAPPWRLRIAAGVAGLTGIFLLAALLHISFRSTLMRELAILLLWSSYSFFALGLLNAGRYFAGVLLSLPVFLNLALASLGAPLLISWTLAVSDAPRQLTLPGGDSCEYSRWGMAFTEGGDSVRRYHPEAMGLRLRVGEWASNDNAGYYPTMDAGIEECRQAEAARWQSSKTLKMMPAAQAGGYSGGAAAVQASGRR